MHQVASGLTFLHGFKPHAIIHQDIKPENTLLMIVDGLHIVKLCDFGVSRVLARMSEIPLTVVGTAAYKAPELFTNDPDNAMYDEGVWNCGCVCCWYYVLPGYQS